MYGVKFIDLFPIAVNPVQLDHNQANAVSRLTVTFAYRRWVEVTVAAAQTVQSPRNQQTPALASNKPKQPTNVTYTGIYDPGTTNEDMAFGVGQLSG